MNALEYIEDIVSEIKQILSAPDTGKVYSRAIVKTWQLIQQVARLIFLLALLLIAFVIWVWSLGFKSGYQLRKKLETEPTSPVSLLQQAKDFFVSLLKKVVDWAESQIYQLPSEQPTIKVIAPASSTNATNLITPAKNPTTVELTNIQQSK